MLEGLSQRLDEWVIRSAAGSVRPASGIPSRADAAATLLKRSDCFSPTVRAPDLHFLNPRDFQFDTPLPSPWSHNNRVRGKLYRAGDHGKPRPTVLLVHGWNGELGYDLQFPFLARHLQHRGVNVAMLELPYHGGRKPTGPGVETNFISPDFLSMVEAVRQALAEMQAMILWLEAEGMGPVGVWGVSLGGWLAGLLASHHPGLHAMVLLTPVVRMGEAVERLAFFEPVRQNLRRDPMDLARLSLEARVPLLSSDRMLLVAARHDRFVPYATVESLCQAWGRPVLWPRSHGHISILFSWPTLKATLRWLSEKLNEA